MTEKQAHKALLWAIEWLNLQDWKVTLLLLDEAPSWAADGASAAVQPDANLKHAFLWVQPSDQEALDAIMHETVELGFYDSGYYGGGWRYNDEEGPYHHLIFRIAAMMVKAYEANVKP